jgi:hypothetical protein
MLITVHLPPPSTPPTHSSLPFLLQVVDGPVIGPNQTLIATSDGGYVCAIGCDASGAAPLSQSASPSAPAPVPASPSASVSAPSGLPTQLIFSTVGASAALAAAGLGLAVWCRSRNGSSGGDGDGTSDDRSINCGSSISGSSSGDCSISGAMGQSGGYGTTSQTSVATRVSSGLLHHTDTYSLLEEMNPILVHDVLLGEPSEDPAAEEQRGAGGADIGRGEGLKLVLGLRQHSDRGPPEAIKLLL